ncbi:leucine-rich repeat domain-containing protein [Clostridium senegalense]
MNKKKIQLIILSAILSSIILAPKEYVLACDNVKDTQLVKWTHQDTCVEDDKKYKIDIDNVEYIVEDNTTDIVKFSDPNFKKALNEKLGKPFDAEITVGDLNNMSGVLDLEDKGISNIDGIRHLENIEALILNSNHLTTIPNEIEALQNLRTLELDDNQLIMLPDNIGKLKNLRELYLSDNQLTVLPNSIGELNNLEDFIVQANNLSYLPESIGKLDKLEKLYLCANELKEIPETITNLHNLRVLSLKVNYIEKLPKSIKEMKSLKDLDIRGNLIEDN